MGKECSSVWPSSPRMGLLEIFHCVLMVSADRADIIGKNRSIQNTPTPTSVPKKDEDVLQRRAWRYTPPKKSRWDAKKSKTMKFKLIHSINEQNQMEREEGDDVSIQEIEVMKKKAETLQHVLGKGLIWALFREQYPNIFIEREILDKRLPDVVAFNEDVHCDSGRDEDEPLFWGESGRMSVEKTIEIAKKYPHTHFCHLKWGVDVAEYTSKNLEYDLRPLLQSRTAPFEFGVLKGRDPRDYVDEDGLISISREDIQWKVYKPPFNCDT